MKHIRLFEFAILLTVLPLFTVIAHADDVEWLLQIQQPPKEPSSFSPGTMQPLLERLDGTSINALSDWKEHRKELQSAWEKFLGPSPTFLKNTDLTILKHETIGEITRDLIHYQCEQNPDLSSLLPLAGCTEPANRCRKLSRATSSVARHAEDAVRRPASNRHSVCSTRCRSLKDRSHRTFPGCERSLISRGVRRSDSRGGRQRRRSHTRFHQLGRPLVSRPANPRKNVYPKPSRIIGTYCTPSDPDSRRRNRTWCGRRRTKLAINRSRSARPSPLSSHATSGYPESPPGTFIFGRHVRTVYELAGNVSQ